MSIITYQALLDNSNSPFYSISIVCARIPLAYLASKYFADTLFPMGLATSAGSCVSVVICIGVFIWMQREEEKNGKKRIILNR